MLTYFSNSQGYANLGTDLSISSSEKELGYFWSIQAGFSRTGAATSQKHSKSSLTFSLKISQHISRYDNKILEVMFILDYTTMLLKL